MKRLLTLILATIFVLPTVLASYNNYESYGDYDYSYHKDFEYVNYQETEDAYRNYAHDSCGYYDYDYYGSRCNNYGDSYSYHRSRNFEFGRYSEDIYASGDYNSGYYNNRYDSYYYPYNSYYPSQGYYPTYDYNYDTDYEGGRWSAGIGAGVYGYLPYKY